MKKLTKKEEGFAKILNPLAFVGVNKTDFKKQYKGKLPFDLDEAWDWIVENRKPSKKKD